MDEVLLTPRSALHALQPLGGGEDVESLTSYFCRLSASHCTSTTQLSRGICDHFELMVADDFDWHNRHISGLREAAQHWSAALSALTSVARLDRLTFLPWKDVIAQNGLAIHRAGQFCPVCLHEDLAQGRTPYLRLCWEPKLVSVCHKHHVPLEDQCHCCFKKNIRHASAFVIPGWCTACGQFLGREVAAQKLEAQSLWKAQQVAQMVGWQQSATVPLQREQLQHAIQSITEVMCGGSSTAFAKVFGFPKTTVHSWLKECNVPTLEKSLQIASQAGLSATDLLSGALQNWQPPPSQWQMPLFEEESSSVHESERQAAREIDWAEINNKLQQMLQADPPVTVIAAAEQLNLDPRQLYLRCNAVTRQLGQRSKQYSAQRKKNNQAAAAPHLYALAELLNAQGRSLTMREATKSIPKEIINKVERCWDFIQVIRIADELDFNSRSLWNKNATNGSCTAMHH